MQRPLSHDKLSRGIVARYIIGVDVIGSFVVVDGLQLEARMIVREDVGKTIFGTITR
jgi:hypothetical protein